MALNTRLAVLNQNGACDFIVDSLDASGKLVIYDGAQPTDPDTGLGAQVVLATLPLSATAFGAAAAGVATAAAITDDSSIAVTSTAAWFSFKTSGDVRKFEGSVGTSGANLNFNSVDFQSGATCSVTDFTVTVPMQGA